MPLKKAPSPEGAFALHKQAQEPVEGGDGQHGQNGGAQGEDHSIFRVAAVLISKSGSQAGSGGGIGHEHAQNNALHRQIPRQILQ